MLIRLACGPCAPSREQAVVALTNLASRTFCAEDTVAAGGVSALVQLALVIALPTSQRTALTLTVLASHVQNRQAVAQRAARTQPMASTL